MWQWPAHVCINMLFGQVGVSKLKRTLCMYIWNCEDSSSSFRAGQFYTLNDGWRRYCGEEIPHLNLRSKQNYGQSELMNTLIGILLLSNICLSANKYFNEHIRVVHCKGHELVNINGLKSSKQSSLSHPPACGSAIHTRYWGQGGRLAPVCWKSRQGKELNTEARLFGLFPVFPCSRDLIETLKKIDGN